MDKSIHLDIDKVSLENKEIIKKISNIYDSNELGLSEYLVITKKLNTNNLLSDYNLLLSDVKENIDSFNIGKNIYQTINRAVKAESYKNIYDIIAPELGENVLRNNSFITTKLMEMNNVYRFFSFLNTMPGTNGKPINIFQIPDFQ